MKKYNNPETMVLQVMNTTAICVGSAPSGGGQLGTMSNGSVQLGTMQNTTSNTW